MRKAIIALILAGLLALATTVPALAAGPGTGGTVSGILGGVSDICQAGDVEDCEDALEGAIGADGSVVDAATP